jgi:methionine synthase II (cobalamin-independent)
MKDKISKDIEIEDLVRILPQSVTYLRENGIRCLRCGEPIWGTLEEAVKQKGFSDTDLVKFINDLNSHLQKNS